MEIYIYTHICYNKNNKKNTEEREEKPVTGYTHIYIYINNGV